MATLTISEALSRLETLGQRVADTAADVMRAEAPVKTGALAKSIDVQQVGASTWSVGTSIHYAEYVEYGRGEVKPKGKPDGAKSLHWDDVFAMRSKPVPPNDFVGRTARRLEGMSFSL